MSGWRCDDAVAARGAVNWLRLAGMGLGMWMAGRRRRGGALWGFAITEALVAVRVAENQKVLDADPRLVGCKANADGSCCPL